MQDRNCSRGRPTTRGAYCAIADFASAGLRAAFDPAQEQRAPRVVRQPRVAKSGGGPSDAPVGWLPRGRGSSGGARSAGSQGVGGLWCGGSLRVPLRPDTVPVPNGPFHAPSLCRVSAGDMVAPHNNTQLRTGPGVAVAPGG